MPIFFLLAVDRADIMVSILELGKLRPKKDNLSKVIQLRSRSEIRTSGSKFYVLGSQCGIKDWEGTLLGTKSCVPDPKFENILATIASSTICTCFSHNAIQKLWSYVHRWLFQMPHMVYYNSSSPVWYCLFSGILSDFKLKVKLMPR